VVDSEAHYFMKHRKLSTNSAIIIMN